MQSESFIRFNGIRFAAGALLLMIPQLAHAISASPGEMAAMHHWVAAKFKSIDITELPFSFTYEGRPSGEVLEDWKLERDLSKMDPRKSEHTLRFTDPKSGLVLRCVVVEYHDFPTVEWTLHFKNTGVRDTPILHNIQALDIRFQRGVKDKFLLHHFKGYSWTPSDYAPLETLMKPNTTRRFVPTGGRPVSDNWPYYNLQWGSEGMILAVGWPGQWAAEFVRDAGAGMWIRAGQERTRFKLLPGEEVRTPRIVLQFWKGRDWIESQNIWRRWMMAHNMPRPGGKLPPPLAFGGSIRVLKEMTKANEQNQLMFIDRYLEERLKIDYWWMDAGWYPCGGRWEMTGTWEIDKQRFPGGLKAISDYAHSRGIKILVWFEPERVAPGTWLAEKHPEWILAGGKDGLLNLGNSGAWNWLIDHVDKFLTEQKVDLYRQDLCMDILEHWRGNDAEDRQGITEIKHVVGYLSYWDELLRRHPDILLDSDGRRNDVESMRRAVPLWRSDQVYKPVSMQALTYGLSFWLPYYGTGNIGCASPEYYDLDGGLTPVDPYAFWSCCCPANVFVFDIRSRDIDYAALRRLFGQRPQVMANHYGDYYPLTPYSLNEDVWMAWQFDRPDHGQGMVQAFRRAKSHESTASYKLRGLEPEARYTFTNLESNKMQKLSGRELMQKGLPISIVLSPGVATLVYKRVKE